MQSYAMTDVGLSRQMNQDYIYASDTAVGILPNLYIVADGMGGHNAGDFASRFCVEHFTETVRSADKDTVSVISLIENALRETNEQLIVKAAEAQDLEGMGTTFVAASIDNNVMTVANIGDSRLYVINSDIKQITEDHSLVAEMVRNGDLKKEDARFHPKKNVVTRAISAAGVVIPDFFELELLPDDIVLLCSDGLCNMLGDSEIFEIVNRNRRDFKAAATELVAKANENGGKDNISVILAGME